MHVSTDKEGRQYLVCTQNFEGPDLYTLAPKAAEFIEKNEALFPAGAKKRYKMWLESHNGRKFEVLRIGDISSAMFVAGLSGQGIDSYTSGLGLYGIREIIGKSMGADVYWGFTKDKKHHFAFQLAG